VPDINHIDRETRPLNYAFGLFTFLKERIRTASLREQQKKYCARVIF